MDGTSIVSLSTVASQDGLAKKAQNLGDGANKDIRERQRVAQEFTSFLYLEVLKSLRAALPQGGFLENESMSRDMYTTMMDGEIARSMAKRDKTGLAKMVEQSLNKIKIHANIEAQAPTDGIVSSAFGVRTDPINGYQRFHDGVDIAAPSGTPVKAAAAGKVIFSGTVAGYGNLVEVDHGNGVITRYGHNSTNLVAAGDEIQAGQPIALVGSTGRSTGSHLHFEVRKGGRPVDPAIIGGEFTKGTRLRSVI